MNIIATEYTLKHKSLDIYIAGCNAQPKCKNCHNPETWDFNQGVTYDNTVLLSLEEKISEFDDIIENIMIFGGEPLDSNHKELEKFLLELYTLGKSIWIFTRYSLHEVPQFVKEYCEYIKTGRYLEEFKCKNVQHGIELATANQHIYKKGIDY